MRLQIKEVLRQLALPETTMLSPPSRKVPTKGAKKRVKSKPNGHRLVNSHLCRSVLIPNFWKVNRHQ